MIAASDREGILARFWPKVNKTQTCWLWTGSTTQGRGLKYGAFFVYGKNRPVHRVSYELLVGCIPPGLTIDNVKARGCASSLCVRPDHLEPVDNRTNIMRGTGPTAQNARKTRCKRGHPLSGWNLIMQKDRRKCSRSDGRHCRTCAYERMGFNGPYSKIDVGAKPYQKRVGT